MFCFSDKFMYEVSHTLFDFVAKLLLVDLTTVYHLCGRLVAFFRDQKGFRVKINAQTVVYLN